MTLRDWFAGQALVGLLAGQFRECGSYNFVGVPGEAFGIADAMLAARAATPVPSPAPASDGRAGGDL